MLKTIGKMRQIDLNYSTNDDSLGIRLWVVGNLLDLLDRVSLRETLHEIIQFQPNRNDCKMSPISQFVMLK